MSLKNKLQIYLITYNRKKQLQRTLNQILAENSPIKNFDITILDNASTDGSSELIDEYCQKFSNLKHIRHHINIGGNANICRAFELGAGCGKEYVWVLCDDDFFDFANWGEIAEQIDNADKDLIFTVKNLSSLNYATMPFYLFLIAFIPAGIYKTTTIKTQLINMYGSIHTWYPQAVLSVDILINKRGQFYIPSKNFVIRKTSDDIADVKNVLFRGQANTDIPDYLERMYWHIGYMKALRIVKDKKTRQQLCEQVHFTEDFDQTNTSYIKFVLWFNKKYKNGNLDNYWDIFSSVSLSMKIYACYYLLFSPLLDNVYIYKTAKDIRLCLFGLKLKIFPRIKQKNRIYKGGGGNSY